MENSEEKTENEINKFTAFIELKDNKCNNFIQDFYYEYEHRDRLPDDFYQNIVELENLIFINETQNEAIVEELASLYKTGVEHFSGGLSPEKQNFYFQKMQILLTNKKVIKSIDRLFHAELNTSINTEISVFKVGTFTNNNTTILRSASNRRKTKYSNKIKLFLNNLKSKIVCDEKLDEFENSINNGIITIENDLELQTRNFKDKVKRKMRVSFVNKTPKNSTKNVLRNSAFGTEPKILTKPYIINKGDKFYPVIQEFIKQFQIAYHSTIFEKTIEFTKKTSIQLFQKKVNDYLKYEDDIQNFNMLSLIEEDEKNINLLKLIIESLELEKKTVLFKSNTLIKHIFKEFITRGKAINLVEYEAIQVLINESFNNFIKVFKY